jgi:hypothetical protein
MLCTSSFAHGLKKVIAASAVSTERVGEAGQVLSRRGPVDCGIAGGLLLPLKKKRQE